MAEFIWSMSISFQLLFIIVSGVLYLYLKSQSFKYYAIYNIFLLIYIFSRLDESYDSFVNFIALFLGERNANVFTEIACFFIQIGFYNFYAVFAFYFLDLQRHKKNFFSIVIKTLKTIGIFFFLFGVFCYFLKNSNLYFDVYTFFYIPVMLTLFVPTIIYAVKYSGAHKVFFLTGMSLFVAFALIAFAGSNIASLEMNNPIIFFYIGIILETIFFSLGLAFKLKIYNDQRSKIRFEITKHKHKQQISRFQGLLQGEEKERKRMAEELHDGIAGDLTAIKFQLSTFKMEETSEKNKAVIEEVSKIIENSYEQIREISHNLSPSSIINYGLIRTLENFSLKIEKNYGVKFSFEYFGDALPQLTKMVQIHIYRIIQELVSNFLKHADATEGRLEIHYEKPMMKIIVIDNGKGFSRKEISSGIGFSNIDSRIKFLNAKFVKAKTDLGTKFIIEINTSLLPDHGN